MTLRAFGLSLLCAAALPVAGCQSRCGRGTVENPAGDCVPAGASPFLPCDLDAGGILVGGMCVPAGVGPFFCGDNTKWDPQTGKCVGNQTGPMGCSRSCPAASGTSFCVTGTIRQFVNPANKVMPSAASHARVRIYEPVSFVTGGPGTPPVKTTDIENDGCYIVDGLTRASFSVGLVAVAIDDTDMTTDDYVLAGVVAPIPPGANVTTDAYLVAQANVAAWQTQIGAGIPAGCGGLLACGVWIGLYLDASGNPVAGVRPTRPGNPDPTPAELFCFRGSRMQLTTQDVTDATGLCIISPDAVEPHSGTCATPPCTCTGGPCTPSWPSPNTGTTPSVVLVQPLVAM